MKLEEVSDPLHDFATRLFGHIRELAGAEPKYMDCKWYRVPPSGKVCLYLYIIGNRGRGSHANSVHLVALRDEEFAKFPWIEEGDAFFGKPSADFYARPDDPRAMARAETFIKLAFSAVANNIFSSETQDSKARREFAKHVIAIVNKTPEAPMAARWLKQMLGTIGKATANAILQVLENVASDALTRILRGG